MRIVQTSYPRVKKIYSYDITQEELDKIDDQVEEEVAEAVKFADESPEPGLDTLYDHIYVEG